MRPRPSAETVLRAAVLALLAALLAFPLANDALDLVPEDAPAGMAPAEPPAPITWKRFLDRRWQRHVETRAKKASGLWRPLVRVGNEIYRAAFGQIAAYRGGSVQLGREGHLFQTSHLAEFNRRPPKPGREARMRARLETFKRLQDLQHSRGKALLLLISPNLISLYPELLPAAYVDPTRDRRRNGYDEMKAILEELSIEHVDAFALLEARKRDHPFRFVARSGSHWNDVGSCLALQAVNAKLEELGLPRFRRFSCERWHWEPLPRKKDRDLLDVANLLLPDRFLDPVPYVDVEFSEPEPPTKPRVLLVGTSYLFALADQILRWGLADDEHLYFYYRRVRKGRDRTFHKIRRRELDWRAILDRDIVVVNVGLANPSGIGYGFVEDAGRAAGLLPPRRRAVARGETSAR